jgi:hypothetical protein
MSYYFVILFFIICIIVDIIIMRRGLFDKYKLGIKQNLIFFILFLPVLFLSIKLEDSFHPLENVPFIIKGIILGIFMLLIEIPIYLVIRTFVQKKNKAAQETS